MQDREIRNIILHLQKKPTFLLKALPVLYRKIFKKVCIKFVVFRRTCPYYLKKEGLTKRPKVMSYVKPLTGDFDKVKAVKLNTIELAGRKYSFNGFIFRMVCS